MRRDKPCFFGVPGGTLRLNGLFLLPEEQESEADRKTHEAIERALKENWGFREVKQHVDKATGHWTRSGL